MDGCTAKMERNREAGSGGAPLRIMRATPVAAAGAASAAGDFAAPSGHCVHVGQVVSVRDAEFLVDIDGHRLSARRAAGCLLLPETGDKVMLLQEREGQCYILHVLDKSGETATLDAPQALRISAPDVEIAGVRGRLSFLQLGLAARECTLQARTLRTLAESLVQRAARSLRLVGAERLRAGSVQARVRGRWSLDAGEAALLAKKDVTVDGEKIHLG